MQKFFMYSGFLLGGGIVVLGLFFLIKPPANFALGYPEFFGVIFILYGCFRVYRSYLILKRDQSSN